MVSYDTTELPLYSLDAVSQSPNLAVYDSLDAEVTQSYLEFSLASMLYYAMKEGACSEQSSRMTAMDNASKNAGQPLGRWRGWWSARTSAVTGAGGRRPVGGCGREAEDQACSIRHVVAGITIPPGNGSLPSPENHLTA